MYEILHHTSSYEYDDTGANPQLAPTPQTDDQTKPYEYDIGNVGGTVKFAFLDDQTQPKAPADSVEHKQEDKNRGTSGKDNTNEGIIHYPSRKTHIGFLLGKKY